MQQKGHGEYELTEGAEVETEPGSRGRVLRNKLGIIRKREMDQTEYDALVRVQEIYLSRLTGETRFTAKLLREMHYDWLGKFTCGPEDIGRLRCRKAVSSGLRRFVSHRT